MHRIIRFPLVLPLVAAGFLAAAPAALHAEGAMTPAQALRVLAQAKAMAAKCGFLDEAGRMELSGYVARAEVVTAARQGVKAAEGALSDGARAGKKSACAAEDGELVSAALTAAREAMRASRSATRGRSGRERRRSARVESARPRPSGARNVRLSPARRPARTVAVIRAGKGREGLARYVSMTARYYRARRCRTLGYGEAMRLWKKVRNAHYALIRSAGPQAVARAKARARAIARRRPCGPRLAAR